MAKPSLRCVLNRRRLKPIVETENQTPGRFGGLETKPAG
jgi:hypothetical protein